METGTGERTLMMLRPVRLSNLRYYFLLVLFVGIAGFLQFKPDIIQYRIFERDVRVLLQLFLVFVALVLLIVAEIKRMLQYYMVTNLRVICSSGILRKETRVVMALQIEQVYTSQGVIQRLFRYGDVVVDSGDDQVVLASIPHPIKVEGAITEAIALRRKPA